MKKLKHSKYKNTGVLFELLIRRLTSDVLNNNKSKVVEIINENFNKTSILYKELELYKALLENHFKDSDRAKVLLDTVVKARRRINSKKLTEAKYNLIKGIKENFDINEFFKARVRNYREIASIYKIFEYNSYDNPAEIVNSKFVVIEHIVNKPVKDTLKTETLEEYKKADKDLRLLSYKILVDRFNDKYIDLNRKQKKMLKEYINNISNTPQLKEYVQIEVKNIKKELTRLGKKINDDVIRIKLNEVGNLTNRFNKIRTIKDTHILRILRYYELIKELKSI